MAPVCAASGCGRARVTAFGRGHAWLFGGGLLAIAFALLSPLDAAAERSFAAHMTQHLVLILVAAPLLVLGRPLLPAIWTLPPSWRRRGGRWWAGVPAVRVGLAAMTAPSVVWIAHAAALGFWHIPVAYAWALRYEPVHAAEHASFLVTGCLFWWVVLQPTGRRRLGYGAAIVYVATFAAVMGVYAALLTFARTPWYVAQAVPAWGAGLTALEDQQLAGLIMWIPGGVVYLAAVGLCFARWLEADGTAPPTRTIERTRHSREAAYVASSAVP